MQPKIWQRRRIVALSMSRSPVSYREIVTSVQLRRAPSSRWFSFLACLSFFRLFNFDHRLLKLYSDPDRFLSSSTKSEKVGVNSLDNRPFRSYFIYAPTETVEAAGCSTGFLPFFFSPTRVSVSAYGRSASGATERRRPAGAERQQASDAVSGAVIFPPFLAGRRTVPRRNRAGVGRPLLPGGMREPAAGYHENKGAAANV